MYVEATIQECDAIAYYLEQRPRLMAAFLENYTGWRDRMRGLGEPFRRCEEVLHHRPQGQLSPSDQDALLTGLKTYQEQGLPCSFLDAEGACTIHEVRPYVCCNHIVTTPSEWCRPGRRDGHRPRVFMTDLPELDDLDSPGGNLERPVIGFMQSIVFNIITKGERLLPG
jgi:Fe-S-cluster containining protein